MTETQHQIQFMQWLKLHHPTLTVFHIPNGGQRDGKGAKIFKMMGVLAGVADLYVMDYHLFIEMKKEKDGKLSDKQKEFRALCKNTHHAYFYAKGMSDAVNKFNDFYTNLLHKA